MHLSLILVAIGIACCVRLLAFRLNAAWSARWQHTLGLFLFPPLLLLITAIAVLGMGNQGSMLGVPVGQIGYAFALALLGIGLGLLLKYTVQAWRSCNAIRQHPTIEIQHTSGYLLETPIPFAAQIGFWQSELVISQGLLNQLSPEQIQAVLAHEQAHTYYRDPFWFFWLGWMRQWMAWLPGTERLWQELLLLRELRADRWAAEQVDALLIAEALLHMAQVAPLGLESVDLENACAAVSANATLTRLEERIDALLAEETQPESQLLLWLWVIPALIPFLTVVLHH